MGLRTSEPTRILLVDDDAKGLAALEATLAPLQQILVPAHSGREALRQLLHHDFAAIILDVMLPDLDGFETARLIRERERSRQTPILFLTALGRAELPEMRAYAVGAVDVLFKPADPDILRSKVSVFVDLHHKTVLARRQQEALHEAQAREHERALAEAARRLEMERALAREQVLREEMRALRLREGFFALASQELKLTVGALTLELGHALGRTQDLPERSPVPREELLTTLASLEHPTRRLDVLVDNLLDLGRLGAGQRELELELADVDLAALAREVAAHFDEPFARSGRPLALRLPEQGLRGRWDRRRLEQVATTLLGHALRHGEGGAVALELAHGAGGEVQLCVRHAGRAPEEPGPVLDAELPPDPARSDALALWLAHQLLRRLGGRLEIEPNSEAGGGAGGGAGVTLRARLPADGTQVAEKV